MSRKRLQPVDTWSRTPSVLTPPAAVVAAFGLAAVVRFGAWWLPGGGAALRPALVDAGHTLAVGVVLAAVTSLWSFTAERFVQQPIARVVAVGLGALGLGAVTLAQDLGHFSKRQELVPEPVAYWSWVLIIAGSLPAAFVAGRFLRRPRLRYVAGGLSAAVLIGNGRVLAHDYFGIHLFLALSAGILLASAIEGARYPFEIPRRVQLALGQGALLLGVALLVVRPAAATSGLLAQETGAAVSPFVERARAEIRGWSGQPGDETTKLAVDPWMKSREKHPPIPASSPRLLAEDAIVILLTVDALRADLIDSRKYDDELPTFARLRDEGVWFSDARAPGTLTKVSLASFAMSTYFSQQYWAPHHGKKGLFNVHEDDSPRFPELLRRAEIGTACFRSISWLRNGVVFGKSFETCPEAKYSRKKSYYAPSKPVFDQLLPHLKKVAKKNEPAFLYSHLADPHAPYDLAGKKGSEFDRYLGEVGLVDQQLKRLLRAIDKLGITDRTLIVVSADHGEAFGEHGSKTHGTTLYDVGLRVPLLFHARGAIAGGWKPRRIEEPVTLVDLGPTLLDAFGQPTPGHMMGESLVPFLRGESPELTRPIVAETRLMQTLITRDGMKVIYDQRSGRTELYDLKVDPAEANNLADDEARLREPLGKLRAFFAAHRLKRKGYEPPFVR